MKIALQEERERAGEIAMERRSEIVKRAEKLVEDFMGGNDASHDVAHVFRVRDLALSLATEEGLSSSPHSMFIVITFSLFFFVASTI